MGTEDVEVERDQPSTASSSGGSEAPFSTSDDPEKQDTSEPKGWRTPQYEKDGPPGPALSRTRTRTLGKLRMRGTTDDLPTDWWFASTAIPLVAATFAPMANLLSIAALVVSWRNNTTTDVPLLRDQTSEPYPDPHWCYNLNACSLACGFLGNIFLLFNFTRRIRYIVALPATIILFYVASGILIGITASMNIYVPPGPDQVYSQGFWYAVIAASLYVFNSMALMVNMVGYFLGHYPQHFTLTDEQRNLILQTMMFFLWLGGGAGVFASVCDWTFPDALYFCDVTILTVGFGDYVAPNDAGRGLVFPYSVGGIIILGLMVSSIHKFAGELSKDNVIRKHVENRRVNTLTRAKTFTEQDFEREKLEREMQQLHGARLSISRPLPPASASSTGRSIPRAPPGDTEERTPTDSELPRQVKFHHHCDDSTNNKDDEPSPNQFLNTKFRKATRNTLRLAISAMKPKQKALIMREEKDRFDAMRKIQQEASQFKKWSALLVSVCAFGVLWCVGAVAFWKAEASTQDLTYFQSLYFCYVSLLTIGYGDFSPKSNAGKPFFVLWSLIAIPTMTILISGMGDTVIATFKRATIKLGDFTLLPKAGIWHSFLQSQPWLRSRLQDLALKRKLKRGMPVGPNPDNTDNPDLTAPTLDQLATQPLTENQLTRRLTFAIRRTADDLVRHPNKRYSYEEWADFTRLIRFTKMDLSQLEQDEDLEGVVEWDWLDENSPMLSDQSEAEWILDRLCESQLRWLRKNCIGVDADDNDNEMRNPAGLSDAERAYAGLKRTTTLTPAMSAPTTPSTTTATAAAAGEGRSTGAAAVLDFFTGERTGENAYARTEAIWSEKARLRKGGARGGASAVDGGRRRSSQGERKGPFARLHLHQHGHGHGSSVGKGAGTTTLKARALGVGR